MQHPDLAILGQAEIFRGAPADALAEVRTAAARKHLATGEVLLRQGDVPKTLYLIVSGRLRVTQTSPDGQQIILRYLGAGEVAGYTVMYGGDFHPGTVTAVEDCELMTWSASAVAAMLEKHPAIALNTVKFLGRRYQDMQVRLRELATEHVEQRIAHTLIRLVQQAGRRTARGIEIAFPLSRQDLAEMVGTTLHTVSRTLSAWEDQGIVDSGRRRVIVKSVDRLTDIAERDDD